VSRVKTESKEISDAQIRAMLEAFAGPPAPALSDVRAERRPTRRTALLLATTLLALGLAVPGALALLGYWETPKQFLADRSQPDYAKRMVREWLRNHGHVGPGPQYQPSRLVGLTKGVTVHTPDGEVRLYGLRLAHNPRGFIVVPAANSLAFSWSLVVPKTSFLIPPPLPLEGSPAQTTQPKAVYRRCKPGWALQYLHGEPNANGAHPGNGGFAYVVGRASRAVASVHVAYRDGSTTKGATTAGYFLVWIKPTARRRVILIADDAAGKAIARLPVGPYGGLDYTSGVPKSLFPCAP
jgi:hypothetical protein